MKYWLSKRAQADYLALPKSIQSQFNKQIKLLLDDLRHPSLHAKRYGESEKKWQARVNRDYRFYFFVHEDVYFIVTIIKHPK